MKFISLNPKFGPSMAATVDCPDQLQAGDSCCRLDDCTGRQLKRLYTGKRLRERLIFLNELFNAAEPANFPPGFCHYRGSLPSRRHQSTALVCRAASEKIAVFDKAYVRRLRILQFDSGVASSENAIRPSAVGKKNFLFIGSPNAGKRSAIIYSGSSSRQRHELIHLVI